jgi:hypothetical protein
MNTITWAIHRLHKLHPTAYAFRTSTCNRCNCGLMLSYLMPGLETNYDNNHEVCRYFCPSCTVDRGGIRVIREGGTDVKQSA